VRSLSNPRGWATATPPNSTNIKAIDANRKIALLPTFQHLSSLAPLQKGGNWLLPAP
jgi:hypothetical protein